MRQAHVCLYESKSKQSTLSPEVNVKLCEDTPMNIKAYLTISGIIFLIVAVLHLLRLVYQWPAQIGAVGIPIWASCAALLVSSVLFVWAFLLLRKL